MQLPAHTQCTRLPQPPQLAQLRGAVGCSHSRVSVPHIDQHRARQAETHGGCTLRHAHLERRLSPMHAVAEAQQMAPDAFAATPHLQQPGKDQQQVCFPFCVNRFDHKVSKHLAEQSYSAQVNVVMKFGGSSVANADRMWEVAQIICSFPHLFPCIVLSAMGKVGSCLWLLSAFLHPCCTLSCSPVFCIFHIYCMLSCLLAVAQQCHRPSLSCAGAGQLNLRFTICRQPTCCYKLAQKL